MSLSKQFHQVAMMSEKQETSYVRGAVFILMLALFIGMMSTIPADASVAELQIKAVQAQ
jgi:hypothetical protein